MPFRNPQERRAEDVLAAMNALLKRGKFPTMKALAKQSGCRSTSTVDRKLRELAWAGLVKEFTTERGTVYLPTGLCLNKAHDTQ